MRRDLADDTDFEWLMIDAGHIKAHRHRAGAPGGNQAVGGAKEPALYLIRGAEYETASGGGRSRNAGAMLVAAGMAADCTQAAALIDRIAAERLLADRGHDANAMLAAAGWWHDCGDTAAAPNVKMPMV